jgi:hypothetical protein
MDKVCKSHILAVVSYQHPHVISIYCPCFMFLRFRKILYLSTNLLEITMFSLNFIPIFSVLRIFQLDSSSSKARVSSAFIHGHPQMLLFPSLLLLSLVKKYPWINGISGLVILLLPSSTKLFNSISCPCLRPRLLPSAPHVNKEKAIIYILVFLLLPPANLYSCCFLMYEALLLKILLIIRDFI